MKIFHLFFFSVIIINILSCSKDDKDPIAPRSGFQGTVILMNLQGDTLPSEDVTVSILNDNSNATVTTDKYGFYQFDDITIREINLVFEKEGFSGIDTATFINTVNNDTLAPVLLVENINETFTITNLEFRDGFMYWSVELDEAPETSFMAGYYFFFNDTPDVSCNNYKYKFLPGSFSGVGGLSGGGQSKNLSTLYNNGLQKGEPIYIVGYIVSYYQATDFFWGIDYNIFPEESINLKNRSNVYELLTD